MSLYKCETCGCVENTACAHYWMRDGGPALCSECDPEIGKWHGLFSKRAWDDSRDKTFEQEMAAKNVR
jgi:hypothetical protein